MCSRAYLGVDVECDRCRKEVHGSENDVGTSGFYRRNANQLAEHKCRSCGHKWNTVPRRSGHLMCPSCGSHETSYLGFVGDPGIWGKYMRNNEAVLCDECMWADEAYQHDYGKVGK